MATFVLIWLLLVTAIIFATFFLLVWFSDPAEEDGNQRRSSRGYKWDTAD